MKKNVLKKTLMYPVFWHYAAERQEMLLKRMKGVAPPWTEGSLISIYRFRNVYKFSNPNEQFLIREVIYSKNFELEELFCRIISFKIINDPIKWRDIDRSFQRIKSRDTKIRACEFWLDATSLSKDGDLYIGFKKLIEEKIYLKLIKLKDIRDLTILLVEYLKMDEYGAFQLAVEINYSPLTDLDEKNFVVISKRASMALRRCFSDLGGLSEEEIIYGMVDSQEKEFDRFGIKFNYLGGRRLHSVDCENIFKELELYFRLQDVQIQMLEGIRRYYPIQEEKPIQLKFPPKWHIKN